MALQGEAALSTWTADVPRQASQASQVAIGPRWPKAYLEAQVAPVHLQAMPPPRVVGLLQAQVHLQAMGGPMPAPRKMTTRTTMTSWAHQLRMTLARESGSRALPAQVASVPLPAWLPLRAWGRLQPQGASAGAGGSDADSEEGDDEDDSDAAPVAVVVTCESEDEDEDGCGCGGGASAISEAGGASWPTEGLHSVGCRCKGLPTAPYLLIVHIAVQGLLEHTCTLLAVPGARPTPPILRLTTVAHPDLPPAVVLGRCMSLAHSSA